MPDALRLSGLQNKAQFVEFARSCRPDKAFTPHPALPLSTWRRWANCLMRYAYQAYKNKAQFVEFARSCRPDKAFTP
ncbi:TPA: hypothetical protein ACHJSS_004720, partial [Escherichia coli]